ncbi:MAG: type II toxin-antitoxin system RelB/DinJ family antitoxin [Verrucomicrobiota bacterium]|jgi:addiction module RelB/DinJ family antitoxin|nr:type II toxin-antitoxin system RelB/DinJ family antitoxin [Verrucomicrobiota bacterium]
MATKSHNIRIDEKVKEEATAVLSDLGLTLSDGVNVFLRKLVAERGFPFAVKTSASTLDQRREKLGEFLEFTTKNPVFEKGYKFDREACYDRKGLS